MPFEVATFRTTQQSAKVKRNSATKAGFQLASVRGCAAPAILIFPTSQAADERGGDLRDPVGDDVLRVALAPDPDGERHGGVVVPPGDVAAGEDHDHERGPDRQRGQRPGPGADHRAPDREDEEESADELDDVFFHILWVPLLRSYRGSGRERAFFEVAGGAPSRRRCGLQ